MTRTSTTIRAAKTGSRRIAGVWNKTNKNRRMNRKMRTCSRPKSEVMSVVRLMAAV